jgi:hypothetical protein
LTYRHDGMGDQVGEGHAAASRRTGIGNLIKFGRRHLEFEFVCKVANDSDADMLMYSKEERGWSVKKLLMEEEQPGRSSWSRVFIEKSGYQKSP